MWSRPVPFVRCASPFAPLWSRLAGVGHCAACAGRGVPPAPKLWFGPPFSASDARGVPHITARASSSAFRLKSEFPAALFPFCAGVPAIGVGHAVAAIPSVSPKPLFPCLALQISRRFCQF